MSKVAAKYLLMVSGNETVYKRIWDRFFIRTCTLKGVILKTCVSAINDLAAVILLELEKDLHFVASRYIDVFLLSSRKRILVCDRGLLSFQLTQSDC